MKRTNWFSRLFNRSVPLAATASPGGARALQRQDPVFIKSPQQLDAEFRQATLDSGLPPDLTAALLRRGHQNQKPAVAIAYAQSVRDACFAAGLESVAPDYVADNAPIQLVRTQLLDAKAEDQELITALPPPGERDRRTQTHTDAAAIYAARNVAKDNH